MSTNTDHRVAAPTIVHDEVLVPMRDGTELATHLYFSDASGPRPALLTRSPYGWDGMQPMLVDFAAHGFVVAAQDVRGTGGSAGSFMPMVNEGLDGYDTVEWLAARPECDGRVVMYGASYLGSTQWLAAIASPPHLVAITPSSTLGRCLDGLPYVAPGVLGLDAAVTWTCQQAAAQARRTGNLSHPLTALPTAAEVQEAMPDPEAQKAVAERVAALVQPAVAHRPLSERPEFEVMAPWWSDWLSHPAPGDSYWYDFDVAGREPEISVPTYQVTGWYDLLLRPTLRHFVAVRKAESSLRQDHRLVIGPWDHGGACVYQWGHVVGNVGELELLPSEMVPVDRNEVLGWVRDQLDSPAASSSPALKLFLMGAGRWIESDEWPIPGTVWTEYHLHGDGDAGGTGGWLAAGVAGSEPPDTFLHDPLDPVPTIGGALVSGLGPAGPFDQRPLESRADVLVYTSTALEEDLTVIGAAEARLWMTSSTGCFDVVARLIDVFPDGRSIPMGEGLAVVQGIERTAKEDRTCDVPVEAVIEFEPTGNMFRRGHRVRLHVAGSNFPRYDVNPANGTDRLRRGAEECVSANISLFHDGHRPSRLILPVVSHA